MELKQNNMPEIVWEYILTSVLNVETHLSKKDVSKTGHLDEGIKQEVSV